MIDPDLIARQAVAVVRLGDATAADFARAEEIIQQAAKSKPKSTDIPVSFADLRRARPLRRREADVLGDSRPHSAQHAGDEQPRLPSLSTKGKKDKALGLLDDAATIIGPNANLLIGAWVVHLTAGDQAQAIKDLTAAVAQSRHAPNDTSTWRKPTRRPRTPKPSERCARRLSWACPRKTCTNWNGSPTTNCSHFDRRK